MKNFDFSDGSVCEKSSETPPPQQLYRSKVTSQQEVLRFVLEREDLTQQDIVNYCQGKSVRPFHDNSPQALLIEQENIYRKRRHEIHALLQKLPLGLARMDPTHGRLVLVQDPTAPPNAPLPPRPQPRDPQPWIDPDEQDRVWRAQGHEQAAAAVARMRQRWQQDEGVPNEQVELVRLPPDHDQENLTFRRVCYAVLAVVGCFTAIMLQTLPLSSYHHSYAHPDQLLGELLHIKTIPEHLQSCPNLQRTENMTQWDYMYEYLGRSLVTTDSCAHGVLHIPSPRKLREKVVPARYVDKTMTDFSFYGVNVSWFFACHAIEGQTSPVGQDLFGNDTDPPPATCHANKHRGQCFRGIHDQFLSQVEINTLLEFGAHQILKGGDSHDIYSAIPQPPEKVQGIFDSLQTFLQEEYLVKSDIRPVAFRIGAEGPMDGTGVPRIGLTSSIPRPVQLLNLTNYVNFVERVGKRNGFAQFSLPWPFRVQPYRDECNLLADTQADERFAIHTMVFLSEGAGADFRGGEALYVDDHPSNANSRRKIRRGLVIDGAAGRLVVSTGGLENRRCRLPIRAGVRAALQIWWQ